MKRPEKTTMLSKAAPLPPVLCLRSALDCMRRDSAACPVETGGILLGSRSAAGALLVTHATPPGPQAVHSACLFRGDHNYYQSILNSLFRRYGVDYVGEWHRHPGTMSSPSDIDHQTAIKILNAPEYSVSSILCVITLFDHRAGFRANPFHISREHPRFVPVVWHEMRVGLEEDIAFSAKDPTDLFLGWKAAWSQDAERKE